MAIYLDHTIVPAHDKEKSAKFLAGIMGLEYNGLFGHFAPVKVNEHLSLDFDNRTDFQGSHYAFIVTDDEFDGILGRVQSAGLKYGSSPFAQDDMQINHRHTGRGFYFRASHGSLPSHVPDMLTVRIEQLTVWGLSPHWTRSLVGCSPNMVSL